MDKVRFGRALGYGTRHAAKTIAAAVDAAAAPNGENSAARSEPPVRVVRRGVSPKAARSGVRQLGRSLWKPIAVFSGVLWLRVTGLFFGLIAWAMGTGAWRLHWALWAGSASPQARHFWLFAAFGVLFGYFAVSSFVRASLRERRATRGT